jgi:NADH:ubiquinone oxidoreductase subunit D
MLYEKQRTVDVGIINYKDALNYGFTGIALRATGSKLGFTLLLETL